MKKKKLKAVKADKNKKIKYLPINENKEYEKVVLILKRETIREVIKNIAYPLP